MTLMLDETRLAEQMLAAWSRGDAVNTLPTVGFPGFDLAAAYRVGAEAIRLRRAAGRTTAGYKVGFANKAVWRALGLQTVAWAPMYDDTVQVAAAGTARASLGRMRAPKIEPEIIFKLKRPLGGVELDAPAALDAVEWLALGFEIVDSLYAEPKFQPADFVAALGFHGGLVVGPPLTVTSEDVSRLVEALATFTVTLSCDGAPVEQGSGKNVLRSPALCLAELATAMARQPECGVLGAGDLVSTGSLTDPRFISARETWSAAVEGIDLAPVTVEIRP